MIRIGTSGFSFPEWVGSFYPEDQRDGPSMLAYYARHLDTVEINYTFRRHPASSTLSTWRSNVPESFVFTLKAHQVITHRKRLADAADSVSFFCERAGELGDALGCVLFQTPPNLRADTDRLASFCDVIPPRVRPKAAFEFRHESWFAAESLDVLRRAGCALVLAETDEAEARGEPTARLAYVRLRREDYPDHRLRDWATRLRDMESAGHDVLCYLKHEGDAPYLALRLRDLL